MGEGYPGVPLKPEFYNLVRNYTIVYDIPLIIDSVQAGFRTNGCLSIVDYPGFERLVAPDIEIFSKAISSGHYPVSLVAINKIYNNYDFTGLYGNSMCANPKALDVCYETLRRIDHGVSKNIVDNGNNFRIRIFLFNYRLCIWLFHGLGYRSE